jgi:hypothetical protein
MWGGLQNFKIWVLKQERGLHPASHFADDTPECNDLKINIIVSGLVHSPSVHDLFFLVHVPVIEPRCYSQDP